MDSISVLTEMNGSVAIVTASGRFDSETAPALDKELTQAGMRSNRIVINLKGVEYLSSAGIRAMVKASQSAEKKGGSVKLAFVPEEVQSILYTVGLNQKIIAFSSVEEAVASFN